LLLNAIASCGVQDAGKHMVPLLADGNLVDGAWGGEQPPAPTAPLRVHDIKVSKDCRTGAFPPSA
jgi:hypothetical protein